MTCESVLDHTCPSGHRRTYKCHQGPPASCIKCEKAAQLAAAKLQKEFEKQQKRDEEQREHAQRIAKLDEEIEAELEAQRERERAQQRANAILQKQRDLTDAKARTARLSAPRPAPPPVPQPSASPEPPRNTPPQPPAAAPTVLPQSQPDAQTSAPPPSAPSSSPEPLPPSASEQEWQRQKDMEGANNPHIDALMEMTGLEEVKEQVLRIKAKIDVSQRQGTSVKDERFNIVLQGNPGTGEWFQCGAPYAILKTM